MSTQLLSSSAALLRKTWHCEGYLCVQGMIAQLLFVSDSGRGILFLSANLAVAAWFPAVFTAVLISLRAHSTTCMSFPAELPMNPFAMCGCAPNLPGNKQDPHGVRLSLLGHAKVLH